MLLSLFPMVADEVLEIMPSVFEFQIHLLQERIQEHILQSHNVTRWIPVSGTTARWSLLCFGVLLSGPIPPITPTPAPAGLPWDSAKSPEQLHWFVRVSGLIPPQVRQRRS